VVGHDPGRREKLVSWDVDSGNGRALGNRSHRRPLQPEQPLELPKNAGRDIGSSNVVKALLRPKFQNGRLHKIRVRKGSKGEL